MLAVSSYWRSGPVLNNAISGLDMALWDIKGKLAGMPVYDLLGGRCRVAAPAYVHASGRDAQEVEDDARRLMAEGFRHIRCQVAVPGASTYGVSQALDTITAKYFDHALEAHVTFSRARSFFTCDICPMKSSRVKFPFSIFSWSFWASS